MSLSLAKDEHQRLVMKLMDHFESMELIVTCACSGYVDCEKIRGFEPDVRAFDNNTGLNYVGEAKTCDNLKSEHTRKQFLAFSNRIMTKGKSAGKDVPFYIIVPDECKSELDQILKELELDKRGNIYVV
ncbi:hypothetical protein AAA799E16_00747 [Marine Group I thaumarchaeote SCGC AAA799-E16]|nr:hypothetical protein AAA799E16_00747 [Marine Group I thaumarchaeote SCGC AAA799-E16]KFM18441.1 hypothetical protein SCCGRSA3_01127 [Marine Group I thaumarchaeote SCGC RSA3]